MPDLVGDMFRAVDVDPPFVNAVLPVWKAIAGLERLILGDGEPGFGRGVWPLALSAFPLDQRLQVVNRLGKNSSITGLKGELGDEGHIHPCGGKH